MKNQDMHTAQRKEFLRELSSQRIKTRKQLAAEDAAWWLVGIAGMFALCVLSAAMA